MLALFVSVSELQDFETLDTPIDMFDEYSELRQAAVERLLLISQNTFSRLFERYQTIRADSTNALKSFVADQ